MYKTAPVSTTLYGGFNLKSLHWAWGTSYHGSSTAINLSPTWCNRLPPAPLSYIQCHSIFISVSLSTAFSLTCINIATFISFLVLNSSFLRAPSGPQQKTLMLSETNKTNLLGVQPRWVKKKKKKMQSCKVDYKFLSPYRLDSQVFLGQFKAYSGIEAKRFLGQMIGHSEYQTLILVCNSRV